MTTFLALSFAPRSFAATTESCIEAHVAAQKLRSSFSLLEAKEKLEQCGASECPGVIRGECGEWLTEVSKQLPSIVPIAIASDGKDLSTAKITLDGEVVRARPGTALTLNPGPHELSAEAVGYEQARLKFTANVGEKDRRISLQLTQLQSPAPTWPYFALGAGTVVGTTVFIALGTMARNSETTLAKTCEPTCTRSEIDAVNSEYIAANVGLAVATASLLGVGVYYYFTRSSVSAKPSTTGAALHFETQF